MIKFGHAKMSDEPAVNNLAKTSIFTRDFANPPMSLKVTRREAFLMKQVVLAKDAESSILGFVWARPMIAKHMPFSTVYYMGVAEHARGMGIATNMMQFALTTCPFGAIELVCEDRNVEASSFYRSFGFQPIKTGTVGKDERPYTRWRITR